MKKKPYILLELLIALSITAFCSVFFIRSPLEVMKTGIDALKKMELQNNAELIFSDIRQKLICNEIAWESLLEKKKDINDAVPGQSIEIILNKDTSYTFNTQYLLSLKKLESGKNQEDYALVNASVWFAPKGKDREKPIKFSHLFFLVRHPKEQLNDNPSPSQPGQS